MNWLSAYSNGTDVALTIRSSFETIVSDNIVTCVFGGISYNNENATSSRVVISNNDVYLDSNGIAEDAAICFRGTATRVSNVSVSNNVITIAGIASVQLVSGIVLGNVDKASVVGNSIVNVSNANGCGIYFNACTDVIAAGNFIDTTGSYAALAYSNASTTVTLGKNIIKKGSSTHKFFATPTDLYFGYPRGFLISSNGSGSYTISVNTEDDAIKSLTTHTSGFSVTFNDWVNVEHGNFQLTANANLGVASVISISGQVLVIGVSDYAGSALPAATNALTITGAILK
jgi:hypothetical protein